MLQTGPRQQHAVVSVCAWKPAFTTVGKLGLLLSVLCTGQPLYIPVVFACAATQCCYCCLQLANGGSGGCGRAMKADLSRFTAK